MLYPKNKNTFSKEEFKTPGSEYRGAPFWAWNTEMTEENIDRAVDTLEAMGMGGGHLHVRTGLANTYMSQEFLDLVRHTNEYLKEKGMLTYLYDEDRWPSGAAGGLVTRNHEYRMRFIVFTPENLDGVIRENKELRASGRAVRSNERLFLGRYGVTLKNGYLDSYRYLDKKEPLQEGEAEWFAYREISGDHPWFNNEAYVDTLNPKAIAEFIKVTHEAYYKEFSDEFGSSMPSIFTDEPQFTHKSQLKFAEDRSEDIILPYTDDLEDTFRAQYGHSLLEHLPELFWELPDEQVSVIRYEYHDHIAQRFTEAFADQIGAWCEEHGIRLTGHMMEEPTLKSQTAALGEAMRSYRGFGIPGIDMLCKWIELSTAKQCQSAVHQYDREGMMSEEYGVTNWDFDFKGHKIRGDWQAALGVTLRVHHLFWTEMGGEAKRDYPASIGFQSPWYKEYPLIENYFSRVNTVMTRGKAVERIAVIHPIESYWLYWGVQEQTGSIRAELDEQFSKLVDTLLFGLQDFDFLSESLIPELTDGKTIVNKQLSAGAMKYDVILVPNCLTLRSTTIEMLEKCIEAGVKVLFTGKTPVYENAVPSERAKSLVKKAQFVPFTGENLLNALEEYRFIGIRDENGDRSSNLIYQLREEGEQKWLFLSHVYPTRNQDVPTAENYRIELNGYYKVTELEALTGEIKEISCTYENGKTRFNRTMFEEDSLLIGMRPISAEEAAADASEPESFTQTVLEGIRLQKADKVPVTLEEDNVCVLDLAEYRLDNGEWHEREEILRIDNLFRKKLGYPLRLDAFAQPWVTKGQAKEVKEHKLTLKAAVFSEIEGTPVTLAIENADQDMIWFNGVRAPKADGWYVDPSIQKVALGVLQKGRNEILVEIPYDAVTNVEVMYLLGNFGVRVQGTEQTITEPVKEIAFGDITTQGLPFYGGNLTYHAELELKTEAAPTLVISKFRNPLIAVSVDGKDAGRIAFSPYELKLGNLAAGTHRIDITAFGNRFNTFGNIHNCNEQMEWFGPNCWRSVGTEWSYEYQLYRTGILKSPMVDYEGAESGAVIKIRLR